MTRYVATLIIAALSTACGVVGPKIDFYEPPPGNDVSLASIRGSRAPGPAPLAPVTVVIDSIDQRATGRAKEQRCNFGKSFAVLPGQRNLIVALIAGESYSRARMGIGRFPVEVAPRQTLVIRGEVQSDTAASIWVEDSGTGRIVSPRVPLRLGPSPSSGMPIGFALIDDFCG